MAKKRVSRHDIHYWENFKTYIKFPLKYKWAFFFIIIAVVCVEALATLDRFFFKAVLDKSTEFVAGNIARELFVAFLVSLTALYIAVVVARIIFRWVRLRLIYKFTAALERDLKMSYFTHIIGLSHKFHTTHKTGSFISRINRGANAMDRMTEFLTTNVLPLIIQLTVVIVSVSYFDKASVIMIIIMAAIFIALGEIVRRMQKPATIENNKAEDTEKANLADFFTNIDSIKFFGREKYIGSRFGMLTNETYNTEMKRSSYQIWLRVIHTFLTGVGTFFVFYFPLKQFLLGNITVGTVALIYTSYGSLLFYLNYFVDGLRGFYRSMEDFEDLFQYGKIENEIKDKENAEKLKIMKGEIEFKNIEFNYQKRNIFRNFNLKIPENKKIALVGHSGSGKTTLVKLLYRLYDVDKGDILIDGKSIREFKQESLRSELSIVPQECVLFDDTIYNNVAFSNPKASRSEVMKAIKFAQLDKMIEEFPNKENTIVGERGVRLSGGEKQRVSIARAILANKKVLVLDEATSSLDSQTEHGIQRDLAKLMEGRTSIIIAHRLSTIMSADMIVVLDKGKISQMGTHNELIRKKGIYRQLWDLQKGGYLADNGED